MIRRFTANFRRSIHLTLFGLIVIATTPGCDSQLTSPESDARSSAWLLEPVGEYGNDIDRAPLLGYIEDEVIVRFRDTSDPNLVAQKYGSEIVQSIPEVSIHSLRIPVPSEAESFLEALNEDPDVIFAEANEVIHSSESLQGSMAFDEGLHDWFAVSDQTAFTRVRVSEAHSLLRGTGVIVAILDTGIELQHPVLEDRLDLPGIEPGESTLPGDDRAESVDTNGDGILDGALGHGTHVSGIIHAIAPDARLLPVRVLDSDGIGDVFQVSQGLVAAIARGSHIINMSFGLSSASKTLESVIDYANARGVLLIAPAGNQDLGVVSDPAAHPHVIAVAGVDDLDQKAPFSNYGETVDISAPSVGIISTYVNGSYASWSGTSMATPFVSGIAAILSELPHTDATSVRSWINSGAHSLDDSEPLYSTSLGSGRVDAFQSAYLGVSADPRSPQKALSIGY